MKKAVLFALVISQLFFYNQCTEVKEKISETDKNETSFQEQDSKASVVPFVVKTEQQLSKKTHQAKKGKTSSIVDLEKLKKMSIREIFNNNMPFTENKGQLEKWHNIKIDRIGDINFYTQAFGGTAYFGKKGIGIGFYMNHLDELYSKKYSKGHPKQGKSLFFYIDHEGSNNDVIIEGWNPKEAKMNYFKGNESEFITDISNYDGVVYKNLYKNIDLKYSLVDRQLIYDYIVKPGGKVSDIKRNFDNVKEIKINTSGELEVHTEWGILTDKKIYAYQIIDGNEKEVKVRYKKISKRSAGFEVIGSYDTSKELIIDPPTLSFSTWVTPGGIDGYIHDMTVDASGNIYAGGWINGSSSATLVTPFDNVPAGGDAVVFKLNSTGTSLLYASFIGGDGNGGTDEVAFGVAVNSSNQLYVAGFTNNATGFPTAGTPLQVGLVGNKDIFVVKINAAGNALIYSTLYGGAGDDRAFGIAVNGSDEAFITGWTTSTASFSTAGAYQTSKTAGGAVGYDAFILKISDPIAGTVVKNYCTYFGGGNEDMGRAIAVNGQDVFITGVTQSTNLPRTVGATFGGGSGGGAFDAYIARINGAAGNNLVYCTYVGGDFDEKAECIAVRASTNEAYITGWTKSIVRAASGPGSFPILNAISGYSQNANSGGNVRDAFMTRVDATGAIVNSTFMGALGDENVKNGNAFDPLVQHRSGGIAVNSDGNVAVVMTTDGGGATPTLPLVDAVDGTFNGGNTGLGDAYIFVLASDAQTITFTTYYGGSGNDYPTAGIEFDPTNNDCFIIGGSSHSASIPVTAGVYTAIRIGGTGPDENYIAKFCEIPLPVELISFNGHLSGDLIELNWTTASEKNSDYFIIERSADGVNFFPVGQVKAAGNSSELNQYSFFDTDPVDGNNYYRLKQYDRDATFHYSKVINIRTGEGIQFIVSPNPGDGLYHANGSLTESGEVTISVMNDIGQEVLNQKEYKDKGSCQLEIDLRNFANGMYVLKIASGEFYQVEKLRKE